MNKIQKKILDKLLSDKERIITVQKKYGYEYQTLSDGIKTRVGKYDKEKNKQKNRTSIS